MQVRNEGKTIYETESILQQICMGSSASLRIDLERCCWARVRLIAIRLKQKHDQVKVENFVKRHVARHVR